MQDDGGKPGRDGRDAPDHDGFGKWLALLFVLVLLGVAVYIVNSIIKEVSIQNCVLSGRRDCVEIVPGQ